MIDGGINMFGIMMGIKLNLLMEEGDHSDDNVIVNYYIKIGSYNKIISINTSTFPGVFVC